MSKKMNVGLLVAGALTVLGVAMCFAGPAATPPASIAPATMPHVGTIDERFQSYNIEMVNQALVWINVQETHWRR
jgi:hypothetical protein